jgi:hypothetical protein
LVAGNKVTTLGRGTYGMAPRQRNHSTVSKIKHKTLKRVFRVKEFKKKERRDNGY